jgi:hypothetical protein
MDHEEVEEVEEPPLEKLSSGSLLMKGTASLHAILSGRKPTDNVIVLEVELRDELDEYNGIPHVANKDIDPLWWWSKHVI